MEVIRDRFQSIGEFAELGVELAVLVSSVDVLPAIVKHNIVVAQISQTQPDNLLRGGVEEIFRNIAAESIPVVLLQ